MPAKRVGLLVKSQRYKCNECVATFFESLPNIDEGRSVTNRLVKWIQEASVERTFTSVTNEIGVDETDCTKTFNDYVDEFEAKFDFRIAKWLAIDKVHLLKIFVSSLM